MQLYNHQTRQETLDILRDALASDPRIAAILLVGSGAYGFRDAFSDLDIAVVINDGQDTRTVFQDWEPKLKTLLSILWLFAEVRGPGVGLYALILTNFLEVDISFQSLSMLSARTPHWKILLDRTGLVEEIQRASWSEHKDPDLESVYTQRLNSIWHFIAHVAVATKRGELWRAVHYLEQLRNRTIELEGLLCSRQTRHFREVDQLPEDRLTALKQTLPRQLNRDEVKRALYAATECFFETAARIDNTIGNNRSAALKDAMDRYLALITFRQKR